MEVKHTKTLTLRIPIPLMQKWDRYLQSLPFNLSKNTFIVLTLEQMLDQMIAASHDGLKTDTEAPGDEIVSKT